MVGGGAGEDGFGLAKIPVDVGEAVEESRERAGANGNMRPDLDIAPAQLTGHKSYSFLGRQVLDPKEIIRQQLAKATMDFANAFTRQGAAALKPAIVDPSLNADMCFGFELQIALACKRGEVLRQEEPVDAE